jgi:hypothetical protein
MRLAKILKKNKENRIEFLTCGSFFLKDCLVSRYLGLTIKNSTEVNPKACLECKKVTKVANLKEDFRYSELHEYFENSDNVIFEECRAAILSDPINFSYNGVNIGRSAAYELILEFKKSDLNFSDNQFETLVNFVENSLRTYLAALRYFSIVKPDRVIISNPQYGVGSSFAQAAAAKGVRVDAFSFSGVLSDMNQYIKLWDWSRYKVVNPALLEWKGEKYSPRNFQKFRIDRNIRWIKGAKSPWTYSVPSVDFDIRKFFKISSDKKVILAVLNSHDEYFAAVTSGIFPKSFASTRVFKNQEDWINTLADYLKKFDDVSLVVRPHPREFPNKREKVIAEITKTRSGFFEKLPLEVIIDHPHFQVPIEAYFPEVIGITTGWSSVGIDWQIRGKPCVTYDSALPMYPPETHLSGTSREQYLINIEKVIMGLVDNPDYYTTNALSWYLFSNFKGEARLGSSILNEMFLNEILRKTKLLNVINKFFPNFRLWLDLHSISLFPNKNKILEYFHSNKKSFLSNF